MQTDNNLYSIQEKTILKYIDRMWILLLYIFVFLFFLEIVLFFLVSKNPSLDESTTFFSNNYFIIESFLPTVISFISYYVFHSLYESKNSNFHLKKTYYQAILYCSGSGYIFVHNNYPILLAIYVIPIITSCAFSKTAVIRSIKYSSFCILVYAIFQCIREHSSYYIFISVIMEVVVIYSTFIVININRQFHETYDLLTQEMKNSSELKNKLHYDSLTGAYSREKFDNDLEIQPPKQIKSLAFIDIDNFKRINDEFGHDIGDWVLSIFVKGTNADDIDIYRLGGDEFIITSYKTPKELYNTLVYKTQNFKYETRKKLGYSVTISCGIVHTDCFNLETIKKADMLMYSIKKADKNLIKILD